MHEITTSASDTEDDLLTELSEAELSDFERLYEMVRNNSDLEDNSSPESQQVIKSISDRRETSAFPKQE